MDGILPGWTKSTGMVCKKKQRGRGTKSDTWTKTDTRTKTFITECSPKFRFCSRELPL